jgi:hypothetical protein
MRFAKFVGILIIALTAQVCYAQSQPETAYADHSSTSENVHIFPIPAIDYVHVRVDDVPASHVKLTLHNILGNAMEIETEVVDDHELRIKVKELATGYYLLSIKDKDQESKRGRIYKILKR